MLLLTRIAKKISKTVISHVSLSDLGNSLLRPAHPILDSALSGSHHLMSSQYDDHRKQAY